MQFQKMNHTLAQKVGNESFAPEVYFRCMIASLLSHPDVWKYLTIPVISALIGWYTNRVALKMTFYPLDFVGIGPLGWQGIIPARAGMMAGKAVDLLTAKLITIDERFAMIDPERVAQEMEAPLARLTLQIIEEVMEEEAATVWVAMPKPVKQAVLQRAYSDIPEVVSGLMTEVKANITDFFDLRAMVVEALESDRELLNQIFLNVGRKEFQFIEVSGLYFGFLFGLVQMVVWYLFPQGWTLPVAGLIVGWATNWLALKMIFEPLQPKKFGPFRIQGLFIKRQMEVAAEYARIVAGRILTSRNIFETLLKGPASDRLLVLVQTHVKRAVDHTAGPAKSLLVLAQGSQRYLRIKNLISQRFVEELPRNIRHVFSYAEQALDIETTLRTKMQGLKPDEFVGFLRPVFQEDEWKLILVGAVLGLVAGLAQLVFVFGETLF